MATALRHAPCLGTQRGYRFEARYDLAGRLAKLERVHVNGSGAENAKTHIGDGFETGTLADANWEEGYFSGTALPGAVEDAFARQIAALAAAGADPLCVETMTDLAEARLALRAAAREAPGLPVIATMTFEVAPRGIFTVMGVTPERAATELAEAGAAAVGSNCGHGIEAMAAVVAALARHATVPVAVRPNAGLPQLVDGALAWPETPERFAARAPALVAAGARLVGGCCGTTPGHVRALRTALGR